MQGVADAARQRLFRQTRAQAGLLGLEGLSEILDCTTAATLTLPPRPQFVLRDPVQTGVKRCLEAAASGVLIVDGRRMPSMAGFGVNYDTVTSKLLNDAASGRALELADPQTDGCVRMRPVSVSAIGVLTKLDTFSLHKAPAAALEATLIVPAEEKSEPSESANAVAAASDILARVRAVAANTQDAMSSLRFSAAAGKILEQAKARFARASAAVRPPLAHYNAAAADLAYRITVLLHLLDHAASQADRISAEIGKDVAKRAIDFVEQTALPVARCILAPASAAPEVRDARKVLSLAQQRTSVASPLLARRAAVLSFQYSMSVAALDRAIRRLVADGLLEASDLDKASGGGPVFKVHAVAFDADYQLPDLVTDPRRPRQ